MLVLAFTISCSDDKDGGGPDGSLNGVWQQGDNTIEIDGSSLDVYQSGAHFKGTINYNGSSATSTVDSYWDGQKWRELPSGKSTTNFSYTLSSDGKTLTISGIVGDKEEMNGDWTKRQ